MNPNLNTFSNIITFLALIMSLITGNPREGLDIKQEDGVSVEVTQKVTEIAQDFLSQYDTQAYDLTVTCLGDSITSGINDEPAYPVFMEELLNAEIVNLGIAGSSIADGCYDPMYLRYREIPQNSDVIILFGGYNDVFLMTDSYFGSTDEPGTFCYALNTLLKGIQENYPDAYFFVVIPPASKDIEVYQRLNPGLYDQVVTRREMIRQCKELGIDRLDLYSMNVMNPNDAKAWENYFFDGIHPKEEGHRVLAALIAAKIAKYAEEGGFN